MLATTFQIRVARPEDGAGLARLNATVHAAHLQERPDFFKPTRAEDVAAWFKGLLEKPLTRCWIAETDDAPVGYLLMREYQRPENIFCTARHWHEIEHIAVELPFRG